MDPKGESKGEGGRKPEEKGPDSRKKENKKFFSSKQKSAQPGTHTPRCRFGVSCWNLSKTRLKSVLGVFLYFSWLWLTLNHLIVLRAQRQEIRSSLSLSFILSYNLKRGWFLLWSCLCCWFAWLIFLTTSPTQLWLLCMLAVFSGHLHSFSPYLLSLSYCARPPSLPLPLKKKYLFDSSGS